MNRKKRRAMCRPANLRLGSDADIGCGAIGASGFAGLARRGHLRRRLFVEPMFENSAIAIETILDARNPQCQPKGGLIGA